MRRCHKDGDEISIRKEAGDIKKDGKKRKRSLANRNVNFVASRELIYICSKSVGGGPSFGSDWIGLAWRTSLHFIIHWKHKSGLWMLMNRTK